MFGSPLLLDESHTRTMEPHTSPKGLLDLPNELIIRIFSLLVYYRSIRNVLAFRQVSRKLALLGLSAVFKNITLSHHGYRKGMGSGLLSLMDKNPTAAAHVKEIALRYNSDRAAWLGPSVDAVNQDSSAEFASFLRTAVQILKRCLHCKTLLLDISLNMDIIDTQLCDQVFQEGLHLPSLKVLDFSADDHPIPLNILDLIMGCCDTLDCLTLSTHNRQICTTAEPRLMSVKVKELHLRDWLFFRDETKLRSIAERFHGIQELSSDLLSSGVQTLVDVFARSTAETLVRLCLIPAQPLFGNGGQFSLFSMIIVY